MTNNRAVLLGQHEAQIQGCYLNLFMALVPVVARDWSLAGQCETNCQHCPSDRQERARQIALEAEAIAVAAMARLGVTIQTKAPE